MEHQDHVHLLRKGVPTSGGVWADLGSGRGAFTLALADLLGPEGVIFSVDKDRSAVDEQARRMSARFPDTTVHFISSDFTKPLELPPLDGIVMANSLHFIRQKDTVLQRIRGYLKPAGRLLIVEYNTDRGNIWVPHPFAFPTWEKLAARAGFVQTEKIGAYPSRFLGEIYATVSIKS